MSEATQITFSGGGVYNAGAHTVYWRKKWTDDWTADASLQAVEIVKSVAPTIPTATLIWRYGTVKQPTSNSFVATAKRLDLRRAFIKISVTLDTATPFTWYGICEMSDDQMQGARLTTDEDGNVTVSPSGQQSLACFGMEKLLADHDIVTSVWGEDVPPETVYTIDRGLTFNEGGIPNRSQNEIVDTYVFENNRTTSQWWSTQDILKYLLRHQTPKAFDGSVQVEFQLLDGGVEPDWDRPVIEQEHATTFSIIDQLVNRKKMTTWWVDVNEGEAADICELHTNSLLDDELPLTLSWSTPLKANTNPLHVIYDQDSRTSAVLRDSDTHVVDQVVVYGGWRRSVCTLDVYDSLHASEELIEEYRIAASTSEGYDDLTQAEKQQRNNEVRNSPRFEDTFSLFKLPPDWNGVVNGEDGATHQAFVEDDGSRYYVFNRGLQIEPVLPLFAGLNYSEGHIGTGDVGSKFDYDDTAGLTEEAILAAGYERMGIIVAFKRPETVGGVERWILAEQIGADDTEDDDPEAMPRFTCSVRVADDRRGIVIKVHGAPQYAIATGSPGTHPTGRLTIDPPETGYDYTEGYMVVTVAIRDDRKVTVTSPDEIAAGDTIRKLYIDAGDAYRRDYVVPDTVVGIDSDGSLLRSNGGYVPFPDTDSGEERLQAIADVAAAYYTRPHKVLALETYQPTVDIGLGDLIQQIGNTEAAEGEGHRHTVNSPVTQITLTLPDDGSPISQRFDTWAGELEPLQLASIYTPEEVEDEPETAIDPKLPIGGLIRTTSVGERINKKRTK